jgi:hypothetical protein
MPSAASITDIPAAKRAGNTHDGPDRHAFGGRCRGNAEQRNFGRGVEAEPEQKAERIHVPTLADQPEQRAKQSGKQASAVEKEIEILLDVASAVAHLPEVAPDTTQ